MTAHATPSATMSPVGLNPFRHQKRRTADYVYVAMAVAVAAALVLWAAFPR